MSERKNTTAKLKVLCKRVREIVRLKLKLGTTQFMEIAPDFYNKLLYSFELKNLPTRFTEFEMIVSDKTTHETLSGVKVTAKSKKGEMVQFSTPIGEVDFKQFEPCFWHLVFEMPGYEILEKTKIKAELGKKIDFGTIELVKEN